MFADHATLTDRQTVHLAGGEDLTCDHLIVATGSSPARIPIPGVDLPGVVDSTGLLNMTTCPKHIIICLLYTSAGSPGRSPPGGPPPLSQ